MHGGLSPELTSWAQMEDIVRPLDPEDIPLAMVFIHMHFSHTLLPLEESPKTTEGETEHYNLMLRTFCGRIQMNTRVDGPKILAVYRMCSVPMS